MGKITSAPSGVPELKNPQDGTPEPGRDPLSGILNLPNQITIARLLLSVVFFVLLTVDNYHALGGRRQLFLNISIGVFILAAVTDFLDGYLARKWNMVSAFGRIADPIVDKVFICGSFVLLVKTSELVAPWIPVVILTREFLVSGLRNFLESHGVPFGAGFGGKLKMLFQSVTIPLVLLEEANFPGSSALRWTIIGFLGLTLFLTVSSSVEYVGRAYHLLRKGRQEPS